jgi:hypothetical protein
MTCSRLVLWAERRHEFLSEFVPRCEAHLSASHLLSYNSLGKGHCMSALEVGQGPMDAHLVLNKIRLGERYVELAGHEECVGILQEMEVERGHSLSYLVCFQLVVGLLLNIHLFLGVESRQFIVCLVCSLFSVWLAFFQDRVIDVSVYRSVLACSTGY